MIRDIAIALSLANLCFIQTWARLASTDRSSLYFRSAPVAAREFLAILPDVFLLAAVFWGAMTLVRRSGSPLAMRLARAAFLLVTVLVLNGFRILLHSWGVSLNPLVMGFILAATIGGCALVIAPPRRWGHSGKRLTHAASTAVLILSPLVVFTFSSAALGLVRNQSAAASLTDKPLAGIRPTAGAAGSRILWMVFDELDERLAFVERPASVILPEFDRFRRQSVYAQNAYPPSGETALSLPALVTGRLVARSKPVGPDTLEITFAGETNAVSWSTPPNVFSAAREAGFDTAIVGWYHPYGRVLNRDLSACYWHAAYNPAESVAPDFQRTMLADALGLMNLVPLGSRLGLGTETVERTAERQRHHQTYVEILAEARKAAVNDKLGLVLVHWSVPHQPGIYDRKREKPAITGGGGYLDNLALADSCLGEIRREMEAAGQWDKTTVLITSDHWWRRSMWLTSSSPADDLAAGKGPADHRIPFLLKLKDQTESVAFVPEFNTVLTHDLILALLRGEVLDPPGVVNWLDHHRSFGRSPCEAVEHPGSQQLPL